MARRRRRDQRSFHRLSRCARSRAALPVAEARPYSAQRRHARLDRNSFDLSMFKLYLQLPIFASLWLSDISSCFAFVRCSAAIQGIRHGCRHKSNDDRQQAYSNHCLSGFRLWPRDPAPTFPIRQVGGFARERSARVTNCSPSDFEDPELDGLAPPTAPQQQPKRSDTGCKQRSRSRNWRDVAATTTIWPRIA